jgi:threonyl-tRNA synthetase
MVHRALVGSIERFVGVLIENFGGQFPLWLAPQQVVLLPITDRHHDFAKEVLSALKSHRIRAEVDERNEKVGFKIREAEMQKIPYMLIIGDREVENRQVSVRHKSEGDLGALSIDVLIDRLVNEIDQKVIHTQ